MTTRSEVELLLDRYLGDGPERVPDRVVDAALDTIDSTKQRRAVRVPWRVQEMPTIFKLALAGAAVLVVLAVGLTYFNPKPTGSVGGPAGPASPSIPAASSPAESPSERPLTDTSWWVPYRSVRYGFSLRHPSTWEVEPATRDWTMSTDRTDWLTPAADRFIDRDAEYQVGVSAWTVDLPAGTSSAQWMSSYYKDAKAGCGIAGAVVQDVTVAGYPGKLYIEDACADAQAFVFQGGSVTVFAVWREQQVDLLETFLSTIDQL